MRPLALSVVVLILSCGGAAEAPPPAAPTSSAPEAPTSDAPGPGEWARWSREQKLAYMKSTVLVDAKKMFAEYDKARFADFSCRSCHGASADDGSYKMPNPALPKLEPGKITELAKTDTKAFVFMNGAVVPHNARLLGQPVFDHTTMSGFGCFKCHTAK